VHFICIGIDMAQVIQDQLLAFDEHFRPQATSHKLQATSSKLRQFVAFTNKKKVLTKNYESNRIR
jgi:hypothetical protein